MPQERVEAVERALSIVSAFSDGDQALSLAEIARRTGLYKSTILRLAGSLKCFGYLSQQADGDEVALEIETIDLRDGEVYIAGTTAVESPNTAGIDDQPSPKVKVQR